MLRILFLFLCVFARLAAENEDFEFRGKHFLASYLECDKEALMDTEALKKIMLEAVQKCGATMLDYTAYVFPGQGLTMVIMLSESHASIHTYPEHGACFVDLFTCGEKAKHEIFTEVLQEYLKAKKINHKAVIRHHGVEDLEAKTFIESS